MEIRVFDRTDDVWRTISVATDEILILSGDRKIYVKNDDEPGYKITAFNNGYPMSIIPLNSTQIRIS